MILNLWVSLKKDCLVRTISRVHWLVKKISDEDYEHVLKVLNKFEIKTMKDYHDFYLKCDVLLLVVFEKSINNCLKNYS